MMLREGRCQSLSSKEYPKVGHMGTWGLGGTVGDQSSASKCMEAQSHVARGFPFVRSTAFVKSVKARESLGYWARLVNTGKATV